MTKAKYRVANFLKKFGIQKKQKRLNDAAVEIQLLRQAEDILGRSVWQNIEGIDKYKVNYWNLKKMHLKKEEITEKIEEIEFQISHLKRKKEVQFEQTNNDGEHDLQLMYTKQNDRVQLLKQEQGEITKIAGNIRRLHDGTVLKLQTLKAEGASEAQLQNEEKNLIKLKQKFTDLKDKKIERDKKLVHQIAILKKIEKSINARKSNYRNEATENYEVIGKANKALSAYRSQLGLLEGKLIEHYAEIGNHISKEHFTNSQCREATKEKADLCKIIKAIRLSIDYNYELSGR